MHCQLNGNGSIKVAVLFFVVVAVVVVVVVAVDFDFEIRVLAYSNEKMNAIVRRSILSMKAHLHICK